MRRAVFKATLVGRDVVQRTGLIRIPTSLRIRIYDDGDVVITTRGKLTPEVERSLVRGGAKVGPSQIAAGLDVLRRDLSALEEEGRRLSVERGATPAVRSAPRRSRP